MSILSSENQSTSNSSPPPSGGTITDMATLAGGFAPTGAITFTLYAPGDTRCTGVTAEGHAARREPPVMLIERR
jgi:hypothetical protein